MQSYPPGLPLLCTVRITPLTWNDWEYEQWMFGPSCNCWFYLSPLFIFAIRLSRLVQKRQKSFSGLPSAL